MKEKGRPALPGEARKQTSNNNIGDITIKSLPVCFGSYNNPTFGYCEYCDIALQCARQTAKGDDLKWL